MNIQQNAILFSVSLAISGTGAYMLTSAIIDHREFDKTVTMGYETIQFGFTMMQTGMATLGVVSMALGAMGLTYAGYHLYHRIKMQSFERLQAQAHLQITQAKATREASYAQIVGGTLFTNRADLIEYVPSLTQVSPKSALIDHRLNHQWNAPLTSDASEPVALPLHPDEELPSLLEVMLSLDRMLLIGGTGAGKTNLLKHYVRELVAEGKQVRIIDPHSPSKVVGVDTVGSGLNFDEIRNALVDIMLDVNRAYNRGTIAQDGDLGADNQYIIVDEFREIATHCGDVAKQFLEVMLVRARKAGYKFILLSQNDSVASLGIKGDAGLLKGAERIEIKLDRRTNNRRAFVGWAKSDQFEAKVPGQFKEYAEVPASQLIIDQPNHYTKTQMALATAVVSLNGNLKNTTKADIFRLSGVSKNSKNNQFLTRLLEVQSEG